MRWWWFGPAVTKPELEREMRLMKEGGIGGFEVQPVYRLCSMMKPPGSKRCLFSPTSLLMRCASPRRKRANSDCAWDLTIGSGWPYGGPQVPISQAAGKLRIDRVKVAENVKRVPVPDIGLGEKLLAVFLANTTGQAIAGGSLREITEIKDGAAQLPAGLSGPHEMLFFISSRTGQQVKRPAVGAEGYVLDHLDRAAIDNYLKKVGDRLMQAFGEQRPYAIFCDSLEVYGNDWTGDFSRRVQKAARL